MSKLIVEMHMPRFCAECPMCDNVYYGDGMRKPFCVVFDERKEILTEDRPSWCPIKGVLPEEHGDLVDRDALKKQKIYSHERHEYVVPVAYIDWEQAVIEAEKGKR